jgi:ADP-heptose:LPS heptosyltransferase
MMHWLRFLFYRLTLALLRLAPQRKKRCYRLAILKLDRLGDAVLALGAVRLLVREFGARETLLIVSTLAEPLFRQEFPEVELLVMPPFCERYWPDFVKIMARHAPQLRAIKADHLVCLRHQASDYLHAIAALMQVRQVHACTWTKSWERVCQSYAHGLRAPYPEQATEGCLELVAHLWLVQGLLGHTVVFHDILPVLQAGSAGGSAALLVCPMAGSAIRQYPPVSLVKAVELFLQTAPGIRAIFCLPPGISRTPWEHAVKYAGISPVVDWVQPEDMGGLLQVISAARLVLAPDSAPAHLATAMNKPGVFLLGGGHYGMFAPWRSSTLQIWLSHAMSCYQCQWNCIHPEPFCITHIPPSVIAASMQEVYSAAATR